MFKNLKIVGTSHISKQSKVELKRAFDEFQPTLITVELDKQRFLGLMQGQEVNPSIKMISKIGLFGYVFLIVGRYIQRKLGSVVGMQPGADMKYGINLAKKHKLKIGLIDRDLGETLARLSKQFTFKEKVRLVVDILKAPFSKKKIEFDLSKIPEKELIDQLLSELKIRYPGLYNVLVEERNKYMAKRIFKLVQDKENKVLCVIGAGHEKGIRKELKLLYYANPSS